MKVWGHKKRKTKEEEKEDRAMQRNCRICLFYWIWEQKAKSMQQVEGTSLETSSTSFFALSLPLSLPLPIHFPSAPSFLIVLHFANSILFKPCLLLAESSLRPDFNVGPLPPPHSPQRSIASWSSSLGFGWTCSSNLVPVLLCIVFSPHSLPPSFLPHGLVFFLLFSPFPFPFVNVVNSSKNNLFKEAKKYISKSGHTASQPARLTFWYL